jgi:high affinity Mn2+ porin
MRTVWMSAIRRNLLAGIAVTAIGGGSLQAADQPPGERRSNWTGTYVGGHFGYGWGDVGSGTNPWPAESAFLPSSVTGVIGGFQAGNNFYQSHDGLVLGVEADAIFIAPSNADQTPRTPFATTFDYLATGRLRAGYAYGAFLPYVAGGFAMGRTRVDSLDAGGEITAKKAAIHTGWTIGAGVETALAGPWTAKAEYTYVDLGARTYQLATMTAPGPRVDPNLHIVKLGLNYHFDGTTSEPSLRPLSTLPSLGDPDAWSIHAQTTLLPQANASFRSPYQGPHSLPAKAEGRDTWTVTGFIGLRLWQGGEAYLNPELAQGAGLGGTLGLGGFSNGEAQKAGNAFPKIRAQRYFFRQTIGLGGEQENVEDGANQFAGKRDIDRITLTIGRIAIGDIFDANTYAHDPRADFMNWAIWSSAAYDFPADLPGYTRGAVAELNRKEWALRAGFFQVPKAPNSDTLTFDTGGSLVEFEERHQAFAQPGKIRIGVFNNRGNMGSYREALAAVLTNPTLDINDVMTSVRHNNSKYGFYVNLEQALNEDAGIFARASWNDGRNEILSFTDIDRSISGGFSLKGRQWGRPNDTLGVAGAINGLSAAHRDFLTAGGLGLLIGDGALTYRPEAILESYYSVSMNSWAKLTFDYQFITNPAYNADRGPVSIFAARLHGEF